MFELISLESIWWRLPTFIYLAVGLALCVIYRRRNPKLAYWGIILLLLATVLRICEIVWFNSWLREAEKSGLWTENSLTNLDLLWDFFGMLLRVSGFTCGVCLRFNAKFKADTSGQLSQNNL